MKIKTKAQPKTTDQVISEFGRDLFNVKSKKSNSTTLLAYKSVDQALINKLQIAVVALDAAIRVSTGTVYQTELLAIDSQLDDLIEAIKRVPDNE